LVTDTRPLPWRVRPPRDTRGFLSPAVRRLSAQAGVDPAQVSGTGRGGRVAARDVVGFTGVGAPTGDERIPFTTIRRRAAARLVQSKQTAAHALCAIAIDYTAVEEARAGSGLTYLPFVARATCDALREHPSLNATVEGEEPVLHRGVHLGIAVDLDHEGLVVPVVRDADGLRVRRLAEAVRDLASLARARRLGPDDLQGGTFTITNPGAAGTWISFPVINRPQVGILSTDGVGKRVVADATGRLTVAPVGHLCLTFDHRAVAAEEAAAFLARLRALLEERDWRTEL
jgi:2-oxoglutarate dehydrogenase E2 component (dihydrolipoamide succinyltransferase)